MKKNDAPGVKTPLFDRIFKPEIITLENGHTVARPRSRTPLIALLVIAALAISVKVTGFNLSIIFRRANQLTKILSQIFQPDPSFFSKVVTPLFDTIKMSVLGSVIGCPAGSALRSRRIRQHQPQQALAGNPALHSEYHPHPADAGHRQHLCAGLWSGHVRRYDRDRRLYLRRCHQDALRVH